MKQVLIQLTPVHRKAGIGTITVWIWQVVRDSGTRLVPGDLLAAGESGSLDTALSVASAAVLAADLEGGE